MNHYYPPNRNTVGLFDEGPISDLKQEIFRRCLAVGNTKLITQYQGLHYLQLRGLAMGVADSPDLANLYGCFFEEKADILHNSFVPFYGRYIDDCLAIVYASSEQEAVATISSLIKFDNCVIEWSASATHAAFLDMMLYVDRDKKLQHMPYRKAQNHQERIPYISHHPIDVKRGTFVGEMSRLATLSSLYSHYCEALHGLVGLYVKRGYPLPLVESWLKNNLQVRWEKRLQIKSTVSEPAQLLVLKTEFNQVWNYFNATELSKTLFDYWREWLNRADAGTLNRYQGYPWLFKEWHTDLDANPDRCIRLGSPYHGRELFLVPDIRKLDIFNRRLITSRKRTRNLFDLASLWKKTVLEKLDENIIEPLDRNPLLMEAPLLVTGRKRQLSVDSDDDTVVKHQRRGSSPVPWGWLQASLR